MKRFAKKFLKYAALLTITMHFLFSPSLLQAMSADEYLAKAEFIRNPTEDYSCDVILTDEKNGKKEEPKEFVASIKGREKALVTYVKPALDKGTKVLMVSQDMWVQPNTSKKAIRIAANQKLSGNAAYGDIARLSFVGNYKASFADASVKQNPEEVLLVLESIPGRAVTYDKIDYVIDKKSFRPIRAVYKSFSGKTIREGFFGDFQEVFGVQRPTAVTLKNSLSEGHTTYLRFINARKSDLPDILFEKQNLGRR